MMKQKNMNEIRLWHSKEDVNYYEHKLNISWSKTNVLSKPLVQSFSIIQGEYNSTLWESVFVSLHINEQSMNICEKKSFE